MLGAHMGGMQDGWWARKMGHMGHSSSHQKACA